MARAERYIVRDGTYWLRATGNDRRPVFVERTDYARYLERLSGFAETLHARVRHYALLPGAVHLVVTMHAWESPGELMRRLSLSHARWFNRRTGRTGHLWMGRYRCVAVQPDRHLLTCGTYVEALPVRSKRSRRADRYPWSSGPFHARGAANPLIEPGEAYRALGQNAEARQAAYRDLLKTAPGESTVEEITRNGVWGETRFLRYVRKSDADRARPRRGPRPRVAADPLKERS